MKSTEKLVITILTLFICVLVTKITFTIWTLCQPVSHQFLCIGNSTNSCGKLEHVGLVWGVITDVMAICGLIMGIAIVHSQEMPLNVLIKLMLLHPYAYWLIAMPSIGLIGHDMRYFLTEIPLILMVACIWQIVQVASCTVTNLISLCAIKHPDLDKY